MAGVQNAEVNIKMSQEGGRVDLRMPHGGSVDLPGILERSEVPVRQLQALAVWEKNQVPTVRCGKCRNGN